MTRRLTRFLSLLLVLAGVWWGLASNQDWFLFHLRSKTIVRDAHTFALSVHGTGLDVQELGRVQYRDQSLPLWALRLAPTAAKASTVCLMAGVHGNEPAGVDALLSLATSLNSRRDAYAGLRFVLVPLANPWGWERNLRHNGDNRDPARQFVGGEAQEANLLKALFAAERCNLFIDLHEDRFHEGFYLLAYAEPAGRDLGALVRSIEADSQVQHARRGERGLFSIGEAEFDSIGKTTAALWARRNGSAHAIIVETYDGMPLEQRVSLHLMAIDRLTRLLLPR